MTVRESIIAKLQTGVWEKKRLVDAVSKENNVTIQAVYKELRKLKSEEVILDTNKQLSLTLWFVNDQLNDWMETTANYNQRLDVQNILRVPRGRRLNLSFKSLKELDAYWTQTYLFLEQIIPESVPVYSCIPHDWFYYARPNTDERWSNAQTRLQRLLITHATDLDMDVLKQRRAQGYTYTPNENPLKQTEFKYFTVIGDWVFEVDIDEKAGKLLNTFVTETKKIVDVDQNRLESILDQDGVFKMKIHHAPKKAVDISKKVDKYFV